MKLNLFSRMFLPKVWITLLCLQFFQSCEIGQHGSWKVVHSDNRVHAQGVKPIVFDSDKQGWALTLANLYRVRDGGRDWTPTFKNDGEKTFYSFTFATPKSGLVVGTQRIGSFYNVLILKTTDGGESWQEGLTNVESEQDRHRAPLLFSVTMCGETSGWAVGDDLILHTKDSGGTWERQQSNVPGESIYSVACTNSELAWAVGTGGLMLRTTDGGKTWARSDLLPKEPLMQIRFFGKNGWIVGGTNDESVVIRSSDEGKTWERQQLNLPAGRILDIFFIGDQGWIAGQNGTMLVTRDVGRTWSPQKVPTTENLTALFFLSPTEGWAAGDRLTLLHFSE